MNARRDRIFHIDILYRAWPGVSRIGISVETRRSDDLYAGASPDGDRVEAERWPLLDGEMVEGGTEMVRGRFGTWKYSVTV